MKIERKRKDYHQIVDTSEKEKKSIMRLKEFASKTTNGRLPIMAFSGGKDSLVAYMMCIESGIEFRAVYSLTSVDPPELIYYIKKIFNKWAKENNYPIVEFNKYNKFTSRRVKGKMTGKYITMWSLISNRAMPPTRLARYCCAELKERTGEKGDTIITGIRWEESNQRSKQSMVNFFKGKLIIRPIVDWSEIEVWSYILSKDIPYCELYDKGWDRLGCIGCPLGSNQKKELELYPNYKKLYIRSFENMIKYRKENNMKCEWETGEDVYKWWIGESKKKKEEIDGQCSMF